MVFKCLLYFVGVLSVTAFIFSNCISYRNAKLGVGGAEAEKVGVIICDHGSRRAASNERLKQLVSSYRELSRLPVVEPAHMELSEPSIATAYRRCVEQGSTRVVCFPYFLSPGRHIQEDIPFLLEEAAAENPGIPYTITDPLGMHKDVLALIDDTVKNAIN